MPSVVFSDTHSSYGVPSAKYNVRVTYSEDYRNGVTTVKITKVEIQKEGNTTNWGSNLVYGDIVINGTTVISMRGNPSYTCALSGGGYCNVSIPASASVDIVHDPVTGLASMNMQLVGQVSYYASSTYYFAMFYRYYSPGTDDIYLLAGVPTSSKTINLTTRESNLTVNPNGGVWNGSVSSQTFTQAQGSTKIISNPTRTGYNFLGWTLSGGGSLSGATYTFGLNDGVLTANWEPMATIHKRISGSWILYLICIRRSGSWVLHQANIRKNGSWNKYY